jgi:hypothetical protein
VNREGVNQEGDPHCLNLTPSILAKASPDSIIPPLP